MSDTHSYYVHSVEEVMNNLSVSHDGLTRTVARERLERHGSNEFQTRKEISLLDIFLRQFLSPFTYLLGIAALISFVLGHQTDAYIILVAVGLTVAFGFWQEAKAERTLEALRRLVKKKATVIRDGHQTEISASDLVPGDILIIEEGDRITADARLIETLDLEVDESPLTGEAMPQEKHCEPIEHGTQVSDQENMVFRGTVAIRGRGKAVVVHTGTDTELGKIADSVLTIGKKKTPLQENISQLAYVLTGVIVAVLVLLVVFGVFRGAPPVDLLTTAIAVAVAAIPESLIVAVTVILAIGMMRLVKKKALVRKLVSAETLGGTTVACVDKTGTITRGEMSIDYIETDADDVDRARHFALTIGMAANEGYIEHADEGGDVEPPEIHATPTDKAFLKAGMADGFGDEYTQLQNSIIDSVPFSSEYKYMAALAARTEGGQRLYVKGAPDRLIASARKVWKGYRADGAPNVRHLSDADRERLTTRIDELTSQGYRLLAIGYKDTHIKGSDGNLSVTDVGDVNGSLLAELVFVGFVGIVDPVRSGVSETIKTARSAGMRIVMITGDHKLTARAVAERIGLESGDYNILDGRELQHMNDTELAEVAPHVSVYSRIVPHDKLRIVKALQAHDEIVAMTGDGINDAPALKQADVGVAMGSGQGVAKEAADLIILDDNFATIIDAVKQGRVILDNIRKVVLYLLKDTFSEIILLGFAIVTGTPLPILAAQVLWINIVEDGLPAFALSYEPAERDVMKMKPEGKSRRLLTNEMKVIIFAIGIITDLLLLGIFFWLNTYSELSIDYIRTIIFAGLAFNSLLVVFSLKSLRHSIFTIPIFNNWQLIGGVAVGIIMLFVAIYVPPVADLLRVEPLQPVHWLLVVSVAAVQFVLIEIIKWLFTHDEALFKL